MQAAPRTCLRTACSTRLADHNEGGGGVDVHEGTIFGAIIATVDGGDVHQGTVFGPIIATVDGGASPTQAGAAAAAVLLLL